MTTTQTRFAIIGTGNVARIHVEALKNIDSATISVVCSRGAERGKALAEIADSEWTADYHDAVTREDVDVVLICTPSGTHGEITAAAAQAGNHILTEKPMEITLPRIDAMIRAAAAANVRLGCIFQSRMRNGVQATKKAIDEGRLGTLIFANAFVPWSRSAEYYADSWRGTWELDGGGALMNQSIHSIDLLQWLTGSVTSIYAKTATRVHPIQAEDTATALLQFENGAQGIIQGATSLSKGTNARIEISGTKGTIVLDDGSVAVWDLEDAPEDEAQKVKSLDTWRGTGSSDPNAIGYYLHQQQLEQFIDALQNNSQAFISATDARKSVEIVRAIYASSQTGQAISLPFIDVE